MYFCSVPSTRPFALALLNSTPIWPMTLASQGEPTGNVIRPSFHGLGLPSNASHGVERT